MIPICRGVDCHDEVKDGTEGVAAVPSIKPSSGQRWGRIPADHDVPICPGPFINNSRRGSVQRFSQFLIGDVCPHRFHILMGAVGHGIRQKSNRIGIGNQKPARIGIYAPWHFLYFFPLPQGQGSFRPTLA